MSDPTRSQSNGNTPPPGNAFNDSGTSFPPEVPIAQPSDFFPPITSSSNSKKFPGGKIIATFLSVLLLVGGIGVGVVLVTQPQLLQQKAADFVSICGKEQMCANNKLVGSKGCTRLTDAKTAYCCPKGDTIKDGVCTTTLSVCGEGFDCSTKSTLNGSKSCTKSDSNETQYCCPQDFKIVDENCVHR